MTTQQTGIPEFGYYEPSKTTELGYDRAKTKEQFEALYAMPDYKQYTENMYNELANNTKLAKQYTKAFHAKRRAAYPNDYDANGNYIGGNSVVFNEDGSIKADVWKDKRNDYKWGLIHEFKFNPQNTPEPTTPEFPETPEDNPFPSTPPTLAQKPPHIPWTDWIPHTMQYLNARTANDKVARLQKMMSWPKQIAPQKHAITTNAYALRQIIEKNKQDLLARVDNTRVSNIDQRIAAMNNIQDALEQYSDKQVQLQSAAYDQTSKDVNSTQNWNLLKAAEADNYNRKSNSAAYNNIINAEQSKITSDSAATKGYIYDMYNDYGSYKKYNRLLDQQFKKAKLGLDYATKLNQLDQKHSDLSDPANWKLLSQYIVELSNRGQISDPSEQAIISRWIGSPEKVLEGLQKDAQFKNLIVGKLTTATDDISKKYRSVHQTDMSRLSRQYDDAYANLFRQNAVQSAYIQNMPLSNQIFDRSLFYKKGGKLNVLKEVIKQNQRETESVRKASKDFHNRTSKELAKQLGALDKEQLMLLKAIFQ